jgi:DMSO/TMAO reductase YedYZ molybdopterin-dependent catalytic subunit
MTSRTGFSRGWGAACGLIAAAAAMGIGQLFAGFTVPAASPVVAVGEAAIDRTPLAVKDWATSTFGTSDKAVLLAGVLLVVFIYSMVVGVLAMRRLALGFIGLAIFAGLGLAAALTRHDATGSYAVPTAIGAAAGALVLWWLVVRARGAAAAGAADRAARVASSAGDRLPPIGFGPGDGGDRPGGPGDGGDRPGGPGDSGDRPGGPGDDDDIGWVAAGGGAPAGAGTSGTRAGPPLAGPPRAGGAEPFRGWAPSGRSGPTARRQFLVAAGAGVAAAAIGEIGGRSVATRKNVSQAQAALRFPRASVLAPPLPRGVNLPVPGISSFITPNGQFYRVDTAILVPQVDPSNWQLRIHGMVNREVVLTFDELLHRPLIEEYITLCCVSNPVGGPYIGNAKWLGASLAALIRSAGPKPGADQLLCTSVDGFTSGTPLQVVLDGRDALLAVAMNGTALPTQHGFPARLVVPGLYGYVSACKWVVDIEVTTFAAAQGYWVPRGWSQLGPIKTESRIDVPAGGSEVKAGRVTVAGVAWAQHKGIEAVEVRVSGGPWHQATLATVPDIDTWRQWVWQWDAPKGTYLIEARATDKTGYTQTSALADVAPNGATGYPSTQINVA